MSEYPDHLNPFKKRTGLRESFRSIRNAIGGRLRKKDQTNSKTNASDTGARLRHDGKANGVSSPSPMPRSRTIIGTSNTPEMLPRSRFTERVARSHTIDFRTTNGKAGGDDTSYNPFDEDEKSGQLNGKIDLANGTDTAKRRRRKKRAPLPPGARFLVPGDHNSSQWSIDSYTSYDTDYSTTAHTQSENEDALSQNAQRLKDIQEITKEIQVFCDVQNSTESRKDTIEDLTDKKDDHNVENDENDKKLSVEVTNEVNVDSNLKNDETTDATNITVIVTNSDETTNDKISGEAVEAFKQEENYGQSEDSDEINNNNLQNGKDPEEKNLEEEQISETSPSHEHEVIDDIKDNKVVNEGDNLETVNETEKSDENKENNVLSLNGDNVTNCDTGDILKPVTDSSISSSPNEAKPLEMVEVVDHIDDVDDEVENNTKNIAYVDRSCDQLDGKTPTPKIRKHKLGREVLLGSKDEGLNCVISSEKQ